MTCEILFFGATAEIVGGRNLQFELLGDPLASNVFNKLLTDYPGLANHRLHYSINQQYATGDEIIRDGDELAIFTAIQLTTEAMYSEFASRGIAADVHGILLRVASLGDTLNGKIRAWSDPKRRQSKRIKDLADIARLVEVHPELWDSLTDELKTQINHP